MSEANVQEGLDAALRHHQAGRLREAEELYRDVLAKFPEHADAMAFLAVVVSQTGRHDEARRLIARATSLSPHRGEHQYNQGVILTAAGRPDEAIAAYRRAIAVQPTLAEAYFNLGNLLLAKNGFAEAAEAYREAVRIKPAFADAHNNLGNALRSMGRHDEAMAAYRKALEAQPNHVNALNNVGSGLFRRNQVDEAIAAFRRAAALSPNFVMAQFNLGTALGRKGQLDEAVDWLRRAVTLEPNYVDAFTNLGNSLRDIGELDEAIGCYRRALQIRPDHAGVHSNVAFSLHFHPGYDAAAIFAELSEWDRRHAEPLRASGRGHRNDRSPNRRLKIGYISCEFWAQAEAHFVLPLLESHDREGFEIHAYSSGERIDQITHRHRQAVDVWNDVAGLSDSELAERIRGDEIDILVDLNMHMRNNRLLTLARQPAPIQVTWLAYPGGTGLRTIDYRFTDHFMDPPDQAAGIYCEESVQLGDCWCCYDPLVDLPAPAARIPGPIRFGSLNNPCKLNASFLSLWAEVLRGVPDSRLLLLSNSDRQQRRIRELFERHGVDPARLEFVGHMPRPEYMKTYRRIDIALDPVPYNGITTTCDALWMGVPVVSLTGMTACGRAGLSLLSAVGFADLVARRPEDFAPLATGLALDLPRLAELRKNLRQRMLDSPLMNRKLFAGHVEVAYRRMWQRWCAQPLALA
jgi:protein O-GlcNAc transferase